MDPPTSGMSSSFAGDGETNTPPMLEEGKKRRRGRPVKGATTGIAVSEGPMSSETPRAKKRRKTDRAKTPNTAAVERAMNSDRVRKHQIRQELYATETYQNASEDEQAQMEADAVENLVKRRNAEGQSAMAKHPNEMDDLDAFFENDLGEEYVERETLSESDDGEAADEEEEEEDWDEEDDEEADEDLEAVIMRDSDDDEPEDEEAAQESIQQAEAAKAEVNFQFSHTGFRNVLEQQLRHATIKFQKTGLPGDEEIMRQRREELEEFDKSPFGPLPY